MDRGKLIERLRDRACLGVFSAKQRGLTDLLTEAADKIEGLDADLFEAVQVAYRRGAVEWARLNYKGWIGRLEANAAADSQDDPAGCAEREVGRWVYNRVSSLMDAKAGTPEDRELGYLSRMVSDVEEYGATGAEGDPSEFAEPPRPTREEVAETELRPMAEAPRDGAPIIALTSGADGRWEHLNGRAFVVSYDAALRGWRVFPGFGGAPDCWFAGWLPLPAALFSGGER